MPDRRSTIRWLAEDALRSGCPKEEIATALLQDAPDLHAFILATVDALFPTEPEDEH